VVVGRLGVGLDNIDMEAAAAAGVKVIPARGGNAVAVAEYVMGAMLNLHRGVFGMTSSMVAGEWPRQGHAFGNELKDKTLGLVGFGAIAREVAKRGRALEMTIVAHDPLVSDDDPAWDLVDRVGLDCLLARSDVVSLHVPLTEETRHLVSEEAISKVKRGTILVNTSRGGVVDQEAVAAALHDGRLGGAALDVFETEPLGPGSGSVFAGLSNVILTPHLAGNTHEAVDRIATMTVESVLRELRLA
jgi:(S)-sulfolactate dehydrogenase